MTTAFSSFPSGRLQVLRRCTPLASLALMGLALTGTGTLVGCDKEKPAEPKGIAQGTKGEQAPTTPAGKPVPPPVGSTGAGTVPSKAVVPMPGASTVAPDKLVVPPATLPAAVIPTPAVPSPTPAKANVPAVPAEPAGAATLEIRDLKLAAGVEQRMPWGIGSVFPTGARKVVAWIRVRNKAEKTFVTMIWSKSGAEVHRAKLDVGKSTGWRTWSSKRLSKGDAGTWRVAVVAPNGDELSASEFTVVEGEVVEPAVAPGKAAVVGTPKAGTKVAVGAACRSLVVVGSAKGVTTVDVRGGATPSMRARRGVVGYHGRRAYAFRVVNGYEQLGSTVRNWQELWGLELPDGRPTKRFGDKTTTKLRIDAVGPGGITVKVANAKGRWSAKSLGVNAQDTGEAKAVRPKADKSGWVSLGARCGKVRPGSGGIEFLAAGTETPSSLVLPIGVATTVLGLTPLPTFARFDLRWMFNQKVHADTLLRKGRKQSRKGNFGAAQATFTEALAFKPGDSTLAGELAWASLRKGDLKAAGAWGSKALKWARNDRARASARYNLGRVAEAAGKKPVAIQHYRASMNLRASSAVAGRIQRLTGVPAKDAAPATKKP